MKKKLILLGLLLSHVSIAASQLATEPENDFFINSSTENKEFLPANTPNRLNNLLAPASEQISLIGEESLLPIDQAFIFSVDISQPDQIILEWLIAPGHYLYQEKFNFSLQGEGRLDTPKLPIGQVYTDPYFGQVTVYKSQLLTIVLPTTRTEKTESITVEYQGCAEKGFCYPPVAKIIIPKNPLKIIDATEMVTATPPNETLVKTPVQSISNLKETSNISSLTLFIIANLLIMISVYLGVFDAHHPQVTGWQKFKKGIGIIVLIYGILLMITAAGGQIYLLELL